MASTLLTLRSFFCFSYSPNLSSNYLLLAKPTFSTNCSGISQGWAFSSAKDIYHLKPKHLAKASSDGVPSELIEDSKFVPLTADDPMYGPPALLLLGFNVEETHKIRKLLKELDGEFLKIAKSLPRICILSGLSGEETMMFIDAFPESGLEPAAFAALVPNSADKPLQEVMEEIMEDHKMLSAKQSGAA
ncbi:uncharacterized protein LOC122057846 isoform X2 [Macadamia integrifolia]|uniref:uncharacterized protein LOC122057846 isoform X2 n=1 Tax=Macadamia integrifolia TaxID=60698 RepID=UPI001C52F537|nr:uncharacterized protein LOC122057846 isoform X2 [Macadamia integrifolia]